MRRSAARNVGGNAKAPGIIIGEKAADLIGKDTDTLRGSRLRGS
jgi:hypothetical protein